MARTRGGSVARKRQRLTKDKQHVNAQVPIVDDHEEPQEVMLDGVVNPQAPRSFLGGPEDLSVLRNFSDHVATRLWSGEDRGELKIVNHGRKVKNFVIKHHQIQKLVDKSGLASLLVCNYQMVDKGLVSAFVERWHPETSSFHLPIGEMTITLDDVSCLLHLPIRGALFSQPVMDHDIACVYLEDLLGVSHEDAILEIRATRGAHVRMSWLRDVYDARCQEKCWEFATRAFLLFLVGCTIFANKSAAYVDVAFLDLFRDLSACSDYAWGAATLTFLYEYLGDACVHSTKQIGGYMTLLQAWIFEHFPRIGSRQLSMEYLEQNPRASRWSHSKSIGHVLPYRKELDAIIINEVCWMPYSHHRDYRPFEDITLYSGWLKWGTYKQAHLPERVLRQYGHVQHIPRSPQHVTSVVISLEEIDDIWLHYANYVVDVAAIGHQQEHSIDCEDGYMQWFSRISHPLIIPPQERETSKVPQMQPATISHYPSINGPHFVGETCKSCKKIYDILQMIFDRRLAIEGTEIWDITRQALIMARVGSGEKFTHQKGRKG